MMYDSFSKAYDRFVNWENRLRLEIPFLVEQLKNVNATSVLDSACGTGMHVIALAQQGFIVAGADFSAGMIAQAKENAQSEGVNIPFYLAGFGELATTLEPQQFGAVLCLGNSLPHLLTSQALYAAFLDFYQCLLPGGIVIIQNRNFDLVVKQRDRWMEPQSYQEEGKEWLFLRFYDYEPSGVITFNIMTLSRMAEGDWEQEITSTQLNPTQSDELTDALKLIGFEDLECFGNMEGATYNPEKSGNLVVLARKPI